MKLSCAAEFAGKQTLADAEESLQTVCFKIASLNPFQWQAAILHFTKGALLTGVEVRGCRHCDNFRERVGERLGGSIPMTSIAIGFLQLLSQPKNI